jgi:lipid-A-disaccharide synthase
LLVYKVNTLTYVVGKAVVRIKFIGMVNVLAGRQVVKEMVQGAFKPEKLSRETLHLLQDKEAREGLKAELAEVVAQLGEGGAYRRAADAVMSELNS